MRVGIPYLYVILRFEMLIWLVSKVFTVVTVYSRIAAWSIPMAYMLLCYDVESCQGIEERILDHFAVV